jgi:hypothetical protein
MFADQAPDYFLRSGGVASHCESNPAPDRLLSRTFRLESLLHRLTVMSLFQDRARYLPIRDW